ncbi:MAG TPA: hypothetical protein VK665_15300 [Candidatus Elarobacter sp.]|nr:hypothetical protein [Candidatus Elarobacter sp.]
MKNAYISLFLASCLGMTAATAAARSHASADRPRFTSESLSDFQAAFAHGSRKTLDRLHSDATKYHAFRFVQRGAVTIGIAKSITLDSSGQIHIVGEPGTVTYGRATSGAEYSHVLVPVGVTPP